ncbi:MAG: hypothetical protein IKB16_06090 [Lentisphaeria bacterium]|nr:hypothetical protein [Lentisphaeria bacterium]
MKRLLAIFLAVSAAGSLFAANPHVDRKEIKLKNGNTKITYDVNFYNGKLILAYVTNDGKTLVKKAKWGDQFFGLEFGRQPRTNGGWSIWNFFGCFQYKQGVHNLVAKFLPEQVTMNVINGAAVADLVYPSNDGAGKLRIRMIQFPSHQDWIFMRVTAENFSIWRMDFNAYPYQSDNPKDRERHLRMKEKDYNISAAGFKLKPESQYIALYNKFLQDTAGYFLIFPHQKIKELNVPRSGAMVAMRLLTKKNTQQYDFALGMFVKKPAADMVHRFFMENADAIEKFMMQINWTPQLSTAEFDREMIEAVKMDLNKNQLAALKKAYTAAIRNNDTAAAAKVLKNLQDLKLKKAKDGLKEFR